MNNSLEAKLRYARHIELSLPRKTPGEFVMIIHSDIREDDIHHGVVETDEQGRLFHETIRQFGRDRGVIVSVTFASGPVVIRGNDTKSTKGGGK